MGEKINIFVASLILVYASSAIGSLFIFGEVNSVWYQSIKPAITPPAFVFGSVWTILYLLIVISLTFALIKAKSNDKNKIVLIFGANLILNVLWSIFYFKLHNPLLAFIDIIFLFISIVFMMKISWKADKKASYLLVPYLLWVAFASVLNWRSI